jgi:brefeldin A-inhibited guanine nucleotide-exchange protein
MSVAQSQTSEVRGGPEVVLQDTLDKLKVAAPKRLKELRDEFEAALEMLKGSVGVCVNADEFFKALKLACEANGSPKVVSIALDSIQKLINSGFLTGKGADPFKEAAAGSSRCLMDSVIECVCGCAEQTDDTVQLQMIRALLTAVTSQQCEVHGESLMLSVRTCFMIHKDSKNSMNQRTAQASLTQMLTVVTQRMELSSADMSRRSPSFDETGNRQAAKIVPSDLALQPPQKLLNDWMTSYLNRVIDDVVLQQCPTSTPEQFLRTSGEAAMPGKFGYCVVCRVPAAHYCVDTKDRYNATDPVCSKACKFRNLERTELVEAHFGARNDDEQVSIVGPPSDVCVTDVESEASTSLPSSAVKAERLVSVEFVADLPSSDTAADDKVLNPHAQDALMVFKSLCKLSMKDLPPGQMDSRIVRSKRLSLELVLGMLQNCGPVFRSSISFINEIKKLLCISLIKNSVSSIPKIFGLSLRIFVMLITNFKDHLKTEIGVFIEQIFLRILESGNSTFYHKNHVLQVFYKLCTDASTALELVLNFDCDVDEKNIFERMMDCLSKIAQGRYTAIEHANLIQPDQEKELKMLSLQAIVTLMGSIVDWARRMTEDHKSTSIEEAGADADSDAEEDAKSDATFSTNHTTTSVPSTIVEQKQRKLELQIGVNKFNMKPKRGIEYLKQNGFVTDEPTAIADLFRNAEIGLDKTQIGDYLGEDKPLNKGVLYALVDSQEFKEMELDQALRHFLSMFRLPGEAQKIDRMMEKFAEKYCTDNPGKFANADCAFVLSFALIMLQTDLHNPGIKNKMSKDDFVRNNRGINDNNDLPRDYLEALYDSVYNHPISLKEDEDARTRLESQAAQGASQKYELFVRETESMIQKSQELMKQKVSRQKNAAYVSAHNVEHVRPLFEVACWPMLATLAVLLEMQEQPNSVELCIEGFKHCIRIAARFDMDTERDAFVSSLAKFTYLTTLKEMKQKNIECIKALLAIGLSEGNNLGPSWQYVLHCISQLERLQLIGMRTRQDFQFFQTDEEAASPGSLPRDRSGSTAGNQVLKRRAYGTGVSAVMSIGQDDRQVELVNSESVMNQIDAAQIDLLFNRSASLGSGAIVHFVTQLARVSKEELALHDQPRIFSLQKLVEVADYNMNRIRMVWSRIWRVLSAHFVEVILHPNMRVCMYAVDSLRQLANKFLEKDELSNYNFQAEFLRPFELVMTTPPGSGQQGINKDVKELIIQIIVQMVQKNRQNIKSGWKTVFHIIHAAAQDATNEVAAETAFKVIEQVLESDTYHLFVENFADGVRTLLAFGHCKANLQISMDAIKYLLQAAKYLADKDKPDPPLPPGMPTGAGVDAGSASTSHPAAHWFPILRGLSMLVADPRRDVRAAALNGVFDCLREHGSTVFDEDTWRMVFNGVIKPLFDDIFHQLQDGRKPDGSMGETPKASMGPPTCLAALTALVRVVSANLDSLAFLLDDVLKLLKACIQHESEAVARIGVEGFKQLLLTTGRSLRVESWKEVTDMIKQLFEGSMPEMLLKFSDFEVSSNNGQLPFSKEVVVIQCVVQLLLIDMLQDTVAQHYEHIPPPGIMELLDALQRSFEFAQEFNQKIELRQALKRLGFMREMRQLPGLLKQEREALSCSLKILFQVQNDARMLESEFAPQALERLMKLCETVLANYVAKERQVQESTDSQDTSGEARDREAATVEMEREVIGLVPIISEVVLRGLKDLDAQHSSRFASKLFPLLCELTVVSSREVRLMVREILLEQIAPLVAKQHDDAPLVAEH